ncbi:MAG: hypothetical protein ABTQ29_12255, partial [Siculibacillus sp.]
ESAIDAQRNARVFQQNRRDADDGPLGGEGGHLAHEMPSAPFSINSICAIRSVVIVVFLVRFRAAAEPSARIDDVVCCRSGDADRISRR